MMLDTLKQSASYFRVIGKKILGKISLTYLLRISASSAHLLDGTQLEDSSFSVLFFVQISIKSQRIKVLARTVNLELTSERKA